MKTLTTPPDMSKLIPLNPGDICQVGDLMYEGDSWSEVTEFDMKLGNGGPKGRTSPVKGQFGKRSWNKNFFHKSTKIYRPQK